ncbi:DUF3520 domain-containing protein [bacterium]|nr:DUF3520 domain-containing protein [bacterium]
MVFVVDVSVSMRIEDRLEQVKISLRKLAENLKEDDTVDAGEVGAGQSVTALYEIRIKDDAIRKPSDKIATVRIRYKNVDTDQIETNEKNVYAKDMNRKFEKESPTFRFTASVAEFAEILKKSYWAKESNLAEVNKVAKSAVADMKGDNTNLDDFTDFIELVNKAIKVEDK